MDAALAMIESLSGERTRWTNQLSSFKSQIQNLIGDILIISGFLTYCGPFNQDFRMSLQNIWFTLIQNRNIPISPHVSITNTLTDATTVFTYDEIQL